MRSTIGLALVLFALGCMIQRCTGCAPAAVSPNIENAAAVAQYEVLLDDCRKEGKNARSYAVYERCADEVDRRLCRTSGVRCLDGGR